LACALGLSALVAASSTAFSFIKWIGAAYLCFIGNSMLLSRSNSRARLEDAAIESDTTPLRRVFWQGALTNLLNPKVALFFLAFLPQIVAADSRHKGWAFLVLGLTFIFNGLLWCLGVAAVAARTASRVRRSGRAMQWVNRALGGMFVYLGARIGLLQAR
jgi:threonine/homoserine/homoserine lactone efflux protein